MVPSLSNYMDAVKCWQIARNNALAVVLVSQLKKKDIASVLLTLFSEHTMKELNIQGLLAHHCSKNIHVIM